MSFSTDSSCLTAAESKNSMDIFINCVCLTSNGEQKEALELFRSSDRVWNSGKCYQSVVTTLVHFGPMTSALPPQPHTAFISLKFSRARSICGVSIRPVRVWEQWLLSASFRSTLHIWRPSIPKISVAPLQILHNPTFKPYLPNMHLSRDRKQRCLTFSLNRPSWRGTRDDCCD